MWTPEIEHYIPFRKLFSKLQQRLYVTYIYLMLHVPTSNRHGDKWPCVTLCRRIRMYKTTYMLYAK